MEELFASMLFAFGVGWTISIDIFFYTQANAVTEKLNWRNWTIPAAIAHMVLMGMVIGMFYIVGQSFRFLLLPLGLFGCLVIGRYTYELTFQWRGVETRWSLTKTLANRFGHSWLLSWIKASVLAVSWDCIPVAAGIAGETDTWTALQLVIGLLVIGLTVAVATQTSLAINWGMRKWVGEVTKTAKVYGLLFGNCLVLCLLGAFFFLALANCIAPWQSSGKELGIYHTLPISSILAIVFFAIHWRALWIEQANEVA